MNSTLRALSSVQGNKNNQNNIELAKTIASAKNKQAIDDLVQGLALNDKKIQSDCIKVLYEIGYIEPALICGHLPVFIALLNTNNNRLIWGSMTAIATITHIAHIEIFKHLTVIMEAIKKGSVITIDSGVIVLAQLNTYEAYFQSTDPLLADLLRRCPIKQLPLYMERSVKSINKQNKEIYANIIQTRMHECEKETQVKRLRKLLKQITNV